MSPERSCCAIRTTRAIALFIACGCCMALLGTTTRAAGQGLVSGCRPFTISKGHDEYMGKYALRASSIKRATRLRCRMARKLLKAAYGAGPLQVIRTTYPFGSPGHHYGRPTYWLRGGWRCSNGAGGASCFNARRSIFNAIELEGLSHGLAVTAATSYR
jgi:hypothetical protein